MIGLPQSDFWRVGLLRAPISRLTAPSEFGAQRDTVVWLPDAGRWRYLADPFGVQRGDTTHVFVEAFDYRTKHAVIEHHELGPGFQWQGSQTVLARPFHLSYPFIVEEDGEVFMVPESHRAGEIALYRARSFPGDWVRETAILPDVPGAEPSLIRHHGRWWLFYTVVGPNARDQRELHVASAERLTGPWQVYPRNPVLIDRAGARPGGTPFIGQTGDVMLPVQDCSDTYGGALGFLCFAVLEPDFVLAEQLEPRLTGGLVSSAYRDGLHTLSACGDVTLFDVKRIERSWTRYAVDFRRRMARMGGTPPIEDAEQPCQSGAGR